MTIQIATETTIEKQGGARSVGISDRTPPVRRSLEFVLLQRAQEVEQILLLLLRQLVLEELNHSIGF